MFGQKINRATPHVSPEKMVSFHVLAPLDTHWRRASCAEVGCPDHERGWTIAVAAVTLDDVDKFKRLGYRFAAVDGSDGPVLMFEAGQRCFRYTQHRVPLDREEIFLSRPGDWRVPLSRVEHDFGAPPRTFSSAEAFADALHTHLDQFAE